MTAIRCIWNARPTVIIDTDMVTDVGDVGAMQMAIGLSNMGLCTIDSVVVNSSDLKSAPCVRTLLDVNGLTAVPVGAYMGDDMPTVSPFTLAVVNRFGTPSDTRANYTDATTVLRTRLAAAADASIIYISVGMGVNIQALLQSTPDGISALTGAQLFASKISLLSVMGGQYPSGGEHNFATSPDAWNFVYANKPASVPTQAWGLTPPQTVISGPPPNGGVFVSPSYYAYSVAGDSHGGGVFDRPDWDQFAILSGVLGLRSWFTVGGANGTTSVNASTGNTGWSSAAGPDTYLAKLASDAEIAAVVASIMSEAL